jgi:hypothetical protein
LAACGDAVFIKIMHDVLMEAVLQIAAEAAQALRLAEFEDIIAKLGDED